jgi:lipoyl-dependent peroxiredoxin
MDRKALATWNSSLRKGAGTLSTESAALANTQYSFRTRFAEGLGTNRDELIAAFLGECLVLSNEPGYSGFHPQHRHYRDRNLGRFNRRRDVETHQLDVHANVPDASQARFMDAALAAKTNCPISRLLKTNISMTARLDP